MPQPASPKNQRLLRRPSADHTQPFLPSVKTIWNLLLLCALALTASTANAQQGGVLKPGDLVKIELKTPAEDGPVVSSEYVVSDNGTVKMPMLTQEVPAKGVTPSTLARRIEAAYRSEQIYTNPTINAILPSVAGQLSHVVTVSGEVRNPSEVALRQGMQLFGAITKAGGFTEYANPKRVKLIRGNKEFEYDMRSIQANGSNNPVLIDGDSIIVKP